MGLRNDTVNVIPRTIDWNVALQEDLEGWRVYEQVECSECGGTIVSRGLGEDTIECGECGEDIHTAYIAMNYFYPVPIEDCENAAEKVADLPLLVVEFEDGETGLALSGGGMDLSWEICAAYIALGYLPPVHFCELPRMGGWEKESWRRDVLKACYRSADMAAVWAQRKAAVRQVMLKKMKEA